MTCEKIKVIDVGITAKVHTIRDAAEQLFERTLGGYVEMPQLLLDDALLGLLKRFVKAGSKPAKEHFSEQTVEARGRKRRLAESTMAAAKKAIRLIRA